MLDSKFWRTVGIDVVACYRKHIFDPGGGGRNAKDVYGVSYLKYTDEYRKAKSSGKLFRQASSFKASKAPVLTSDLARDFKAFRLHSSGFGFGAIAQRGKIKSLAKMGRVITSNSKPIPDKCSKFLLREADKYVKRELKKTKGKTFNIGK